MLRKLLLTMLVALALVGTVSAQGKVYKVAFIARAQADSFAAWLANSIMQEAKKYKDIDLKVFDGQASDDVENSLIENAITNKFDAIIIQPNNGESQRPYAVKVVQAGIVCITTNARIAGIAGASSVDADPYMQAAVCARLALKQVPQNAKVVVLQGPPGNFHADSRRVSWQKEFFDKRPDVKIVGEQIANWNKDEAMNHMEDWVQANPKIDAIISMNDNMATGALEVVKNNPNYKGILAYGVDGTAEACLLIKQGIMTATCLQNAYALAEKILDTTHKLVTGQSGQINVDIDCPLVTKANVDTYIAMHKKAGAIK
ncbi:MAG: sugar ABC transporter substrate-binding protein [Rectinemataceae bacterium]